MIRKFFAALGCAVLGAAVMLLALPLLPGQLLPHGRAETLAATEAETAPAEPADEPFDGAVTLRVLVDGAVREQTLHDYLVCVLLAEVPSGFAAEALKAQACAARTFALRQAGAGKHAHTRPGCAGPGPGSPSGSSPHTARAGAPRSSGRSTRRRRRP